MVAALAVALAAAMTPVVGPPKINGTRTSRPVRESERVRQRVCVV